MCAGGEGWSAPSLYCWSVCGALANFRTIYPTFGSTTKLQHIHKRCQPPWSEKELLHKAKEAEKNKLGREPGAKFHEHETSPGGSCPYPPVDWRTIETATSRTGARFIQETIYPKESILAPYMAFARSVCESSDTHLIGAILPVVGALLARRVYIRWPQRNIYPTSSICS